MHHTKDAPNPRTHTHINLPSNPPPLPPLKPSLTPFSQTHRIDHAHIIHQNAQPAHQALARLGQLRKESIRALSISVIIGHAPNFHPRGLLQNALLHLFKLLQGTRDNNNIHATRGQLIGKGLANPSSGTCDDGPLPVREGVAREEFRTHKVEGQVQEFDQPDSQEAEA